VTKGQLEMVTVQALLTKEFKNMFGKGKPSKTPAADMQLPTKEDLEALAKASGVPVREIEKDAPKAPPPPWSADEQEEKTEGGRPPARSTMEGVCPVCGLVTKEAQCPIDGTVMGK
jgi:hypothetical protein